MRLSLWIIVFALSFHAFAEDIRSEADYWADTQISQDLFKKFINNEKCRSSDVYKKSCVASVRAAYELSGTEAATAEGARVDFELALKNAEQELPPQIPVQMMRAYAINAHLQVYDPYAGIMPLQQLLDEQSSDGAVIVGVGINLERTPHGIVIQEVYRGGAAEAEGLKADDIIVSVAKEGVNFTALENLPASEVVELILGEPGTPVALKVWRDGREIEKPFEMIRTRVLVEHSDIAVLEPGIGYLRIRNFDSEELCDDVTEQVEQLKRAKVKSLVLDLRGNTGGEKYITLCVAELFLGTKPIVGTTYLSNTIPALRDVMGEDNIEEDSTEIEYEFGAIDAIFGGQISVLIDSDSASGAEILAGAIQDHQRGWLVGERSYGKGSAQTYMSIPDYEDLLMIWTSERFYQPSGRTNQTIGLNPSFAVPARLPEQATESLAAINTPWLETRPEEAAKIRRCISENQFDLLALSAFRAAGEPADYQKAYALGVLKCMP